MVLAPKSLRIPPKVLKKIRLIAEATQKDFSRVANELLEEAVKARECPGIVFTEGVRGDRRARLADSGLEVWEIIEGYRSVKKSFKRLCKAYDWLSENQLRAALAYYETYPEEIDDLIELNQSWTPEKIKKLYPFLPVGPQK